METPLTTIQVVAIKQLLAGIIDDAKFALKEFDKENVDIQSRSIIRDCKKIQEIL